jgi:hypothetical protein
MCFLTIEAMDTAFDGVSEKKGEAIALPRVIGIESSCSQANRTPRIALQFFSNKPRKDFP